MAQAIKTRYLPTTLTKPARIVATTCSGIRLVMSLYTLQDKIEERNLPAMSDEFLHRMVACELAMKVGFSYKKMHTGTIDDGKFRVHVLEV